LILIDKPEVLEVLNFYCEKTITQIFKKFNLDMEARHRAWENRVAILRWRERVMVRVVRVCEVKLMKKKRTEELMDVLGLEETITT